MEVYTILQTVLLSWDTDGDGVVEFHEVMGALKAMKKICWSRVRHCKKSASGFGGRTIEWRAAAYGILDVIQKIDALIWTITFFLMLYPGAFRNAIFKPCWECDDLEAVIAQQVRTWPARTCEGLAQSHVSHSARSRACATGWSGIGSFDGNSIDLS